MLYVTTTIYIAFLNANCIEMAAAAAAAATPVPVQLIPNPTSPTQKLINTLAVIQQQGQQNAVGDSLVRLPAPPALPAPAALTTGGATKLKNYKIYPYDISVRARTRDEAALIGYWQLTSHLQPKNDYNIDFAINSQKYRGTKHKINKKHNKNYKYKYENTINYA